MIIINRDRIQMKTLALKKVFQIHLMEINKDKI